MSISSIASTGLHASQMRLTASASNVANVRSAGYQPVRVEQSPGSEGGTAARMTQATGGVDLISEAVDQMAAVRDFKANARVIEAANRMMDSTLELWG